MISKILKREGYIIAAIPVIAYSIALLFEFGYSIYFEYSYEFVSIDIRTLFLSIISIFIFVLIIHVYSDMAIFLMNKLGVYGKAFSMGFILFSPAWLFWYLIPSQLRYDYLSIFLIVGQLFILALLLAPPTKKDKLTYKEKVEKNIEDYLIFVERRKTNEKPDYKRQEVIAIVFFLSLTAVALGAKVAENKKLFYHFKIKRDEFVIIKKYDDNIITAKVINKKISSKIVLFKDENLSGIELNQFTLNHDGKLVFRKSTIKPD